MKKNMSRLGFTLIELLIVITIIGILAVVFVPTILNAPAKARDASRLADVANIMKGVEAGRLEAVSLPDGDGCADTAAVLTTNFGKYMPNGRVPLDPKSDNAVILNTKCSTTGKYLFISFPVTTPTGYAVFARVEGGKGNITCNTIAADTKPDLTLTTTGDCYGALSQ